MNKWSEGKAFLAAIFVLEDALVGTQGVASIVRYGQRSMSIPTFAISAQAVMKSPELAADAAQAAFVSDELRALSWG